MTFAGLPLAILIAACVIPPLILLYFLKLRRREQAIPSTLLWIQSVQDLQANAPFQRLKPNLLLFLQLLALLLMLFAIARPEWQSDVERGAKTVLLIDRSGSMTAEEEDGRTRLDIAREEALKYIDGMDTGGIFSALSEPERVMVIGFAESAEVYSRFTSNRAQLTRAINAITPTHGPSKLKPALDLIRAEAAAIDPDNPTQGVGPQANVILVSDGGLNDMTDIVVKEPMSYRQIGTNAAARNAGIVAFDAERNYRDLSQISVYTRVLNYDTFDVTASLLFSVADQLVASDQITIPAARITEANPLTSNNGGGGGAGDEDGDDESASGSRANLIPGAVDVSFEFPQPRGVVLGVELDYDDSLQADNRAFVVVSPAKSLRIALVERKTFVLESVLEGLPFVDRIDRFTASQYDQLQQSGRTEEYDVIVFDDHAPSTLGPGRYLLFGALPPLEGFGYTSEDRVWNTAETWDENHPVNRNVNFQQLVTRHLPFVMPDSTRVVVEGASGPLVAEVSERGINAIIAPFAINASNWPWDVNVVVFVQNAVDYLGHIGEAVASESFKPGEAILARLPQTAQSIRMHFPDELDRSPMELTPVDPSFTSYDPVEWTGMYRMTWNVPGVDDEQMRVFAVNMFNPIEGDLRAVPELVFPVAEDRIVAEQTRLEKRSLWPWALLAGLLVLMLEWWVYSRRAYI